MRKLTLLAVLITSLLFVACGDSNSKDKDSKKAKTEKKESKKVEKKELTVETYCKIKNKQEKLLMETYWEQFKGKDYADVKELYDQYSKELREIETKNGVEKGDLNSFIRGRYSEVSEYCKNDPDTKEYAELTEAKKKIVSLSFAKAQKAMDESIDKAMGR